MSCQIAKTEYWKLMIWPSDTKCCHLEIHYVLPKDWPGPNLGFRFMKNRIHTSLLGSLVRFYCPKLRCSLSLSTNLSYEHMYTFFVSGAIGIFKVYVFQSQTVCYAHKKVGHIFRINKRLAYLECFQALWFTAMKK